jgi:phage shock protein C
MTCANCQKEIALGSKFCYHCGAKQAEVAAANAAPPPPQGSRRLMRSSQDKKIAGVCAGVADYFDLDATLVRIVWLLLFLLGGTGGLAYIICWIVMPEAPLTQAAPRATASA